MLPLTSPISDIFTTIRWRTISILTTSLIILHFVLIQPIVSPPVTLDPSQGKPIVIYGYAIPIILSTSKSTPDPEPQVGKSSATLALSSAPSTLTDPSIPRPESEYVAICVSVKDQRQDLPEWLTHHYHHLSIRRFYIMDDGSEPPLSDLSPTHLNIPTSAITFVYQDRSTRMPNQQLTFYSRCLSEFGSRHEWIAFIDVDEFLDTPSTTTLHELLYTIEKNDTKTIGALAVNWRMHTSSLLQRRPSSTRASFLICIWDDPPAAIATFNCAVKSIVRPRYAAYPINPHMFALTDGAVTVGEMGDDVHDVADRRPISREKVALHHYAVKSREEYEQKMQRSNGMSDSKGWDFWDIVEDEMPHVECAEMSGYVP